MADGQLTFKRIKKTSPKVAVKQEQPSGSEHPVLAGGVRVGGALASGAVNPALGPGTLLAALIGGGSEAAAQLLEEASKVPEAIKAVPEVVGHLVDPETRSATLKGFGEGVIAPIARIGTEAGIAAVPGSAYFKPGKVIGSMVKSGAMTGAGEAMREVSKGEDISPRSVGLATGLGAVTGGVLGPFVGPAEKAAADVAPVAKKTLADVVGEHGADATEFGKNAGAIMTREGWTLDRVAKEAAQLHANGRRDLADKLRETALESGQWKGKQLEEEIARLESLGMHQDAQAIRLAAARTSTGTSKIYNRASQVEQQATKLRKAEAAAAAKQAEASRRVAEARRKMDELAARGQTKPSAQQTVGGVDPVTGETVKFTEKVTPVKATEEGDELVETLGGPSSPIIPVAPAAPRVAPQVQSAIDEVLDRILPPAAKALPEAPPPVAAAAPEAPIAGLPVAPEAPAAVTPEVMPMPTTAPARKAVEAIDVPAAPVPTEAPAGPVMPIPPAPANAPVTPPTVEPVQSAAVPMATGKRGSPGEVKIDDVLTAEEKANTVIDVLRKAYPAQLADQLEPLVRQYHELGDTITRLGKPAANSSEAITLAQLKKQKGTIGMEMSLLTRQAEAAGAIPAGHGEATSTTIKNAIEDANAEKFASQIPLGAPKPEPPGGPIFAAEPPMEGPLPLAGSKVGNEDLGPLDLTYNPELAVESRVTRAMQEAKKPATVEGAAPVVEPPPTTEGGGTVLGSGLGAFQQIIEKNPQLAARLGLAAGGAIVGGATDPLDDPLLSMTAGAGIGMAAPEVLKGIRSMGVRPTEVPEVVHAMQRDPAEAQSIGQAVWHLVPHVQRFNYLLSIPGLSANAIAGPYGSGFFGFLAKGLGGDPRGWQALRKMTPGNWANEFWTGRNKALEMIQHAEQGDPLARAEIGGPAVDALTGILGQNVGKVGQRVLQAPAVGMQAGDLATRTIAQNAGFSEQEAREITLTSELFIPLLRDLNNFARGKDPSVIKGLIFPFVRTPLNVVEQGLTRFPGVGFKAQAIREAHGAPKMTFQAQAAQQALGGLMMFAGFAIGASTDPNGTGITSPNIVKRFLTNAAGPYSALAALGYAAGQAQAKGQPGIMPVASEAINALPLPAMQPITDAFRLADKVYQGQDVGMSDIPRGAIPAVIREPQPYGMGPEPNQTGIGLKLPDTGGLTFKRIK